MSERRWDVPESWAWASAEQISEIVGGGTPSTSDPTNFSKDGVPWLTPADLTDYRKTYIAKGRRDLSDKGLRSSGATLMPAGTVLFSSRAPVGYCAIAANEISTNQGFKSFVLKGGMLPEYVRHYLLGSIDYAESLASGTTFKELSGARAAQLAIPVAPIPEQRRITAKLDSLFARTKAARDELTRIPLLIEHYKQAILEKAFNGELTADWRADRKRGEPEEVQLGTIVSNFSYGSAAKSSPEGCVPVLRMGNIQDGRLDWSDLVFTSDEREIEKYALSEGDVLFNRTNSPALVGKTALYSGERPAIYAGYLIRVRCNERLDPRYLTYCLNSPQGRDYCWQVKTDGVSQSNINAKKLAAFTIRLPERDEQAEIVHRIEAAMDWLNVVVSEQDKASYLLDHLDQALLGKAFRGELVPQDPNDEPAEKLLERIRSARAAQPKPRRARSAEKAKA